MMMENELIEKFVTFGFLALWLAFPFGLFISIMQSDHDQVYDSVVPNYNLKFHVHHLKEETANPFEFRISQILHDKRVSHFDHAWV